MILNYIRTEKLAVATGAAASTTFVNADRPMTLAVVSSAPFHASVVGTATTSDAYHPANQIHIIPVPAGKTLSLRGTSSTDAWVSEVAIVPNTGI